MARKESPEEMQRDSGDRPGKSKGLGEGGFAEGEHGRGPTPYLKSHSAKPGGFSPAPFAGTAGRGGSGILGKGDSFKGAHTDIAHPQSHAEFESLGADTE